MTPLSLFSRGALSALIATALLSGCQPSTTPQADTDTDATSVPTDDLEFSETEVTEEQIAAIEAICEDQKQGHIIDCGMSPPEEDFKCRTEKADQMYRECVASMIIRQFLGEEPPSTEMDASMTHY